MGHVQGEARAPQARVPQQQLDAAQVDSRFEQMCREAVAERISTLLIIRRSSVFATATIPSLGKPSKSSGGYGVRPRIA